MPVIECRQCHKILQYEKVKDLPFFPFCSKRCKLIDLGEWFDEEHRVPGESEPPDDEEQPPARPRKSP